MLPTVNVWPKPTSIAPALILVATALSLGVVAIVRQLTGVGR